MTVHRWKDQQPMIFRFPPQRSNASGETRVATLSSDIPTSNRRVFLRRAGAMLAIGAPALKLLAGPGEAAAACLTTTAAVSPDANCSSCCQKVRWELDYTGCGTANQLPEGCPAGEEFVCYGNYTIYSVNCAGFVCGQETLNDGTCSVV